MLCVEDKATDCVRSRQVGDLDDDVVMLSAAQHLIDGWKLAIETHVHHAAANRDDRANGRSCRIVVRRETHHPSINVIGHDAIVQNRLPPW